MDLLSNLRMECFQIYSEISILTLCCIYATKKIFITSFETNKLNANEVMLKSFKYIQNLKNLFHVC